MTEYSVLIPCTMSISVVVEAENKEEAKRKALDVDLRVKIESDDTADPQVNYFKMHRMIADGNLYHGCINEMDVEKL